MQVDDSVRVITKNINFSIVGQKAIPVNFGIGHKDWVVQLLGITNSIWIELVTEFSWCAVCLCEDPRLLTTPPTLHQMYELDSCYALWAYPLYHTLNCTTLRDSAHLPLYGLLRPFRQLLCFATGYAVPMKFKVEIFYRMVKISPEESSALARQKGAYRRT